MRKSADRKFAKQGGTLENRGAISAPHPVLLLSRCTVLWEFKQCVLYYRFGAFRWFTSNT